MAAWGLNQNLFYIVRNIVTDQLWHEVSVSNNKFCQHNETTTFQQPFFMLELPISVVRLLSLATFYVRACNISNKTHIISVVVIFKSNKIRTHNKIRTRKIRIHYIKLLNFSDSISCDFSFIGKLYEKSDVQS